MRRSIAILVAFVLLTGSTQRVLARPTLRQSTWDELSRMIPGMYIRVILPDTTRIRGRAIQVRPDVLVIDIRRTSNPRLHAKGLTDIPRSDVSNIELRLRHLPGATPDVDGIVNGIGAGLGVVAVSPLLFYLGETEKISNWAIVVILIGAGAGGAMIARRLISRPHDDPYHVLITVVP